MVPKQNIKDLALESSNDRADTFSGAKVSNSNLILTWPYKTPSPEYMAKLGFYFTPTKRLKDRVTCFCCNKVQSTWKNVKDPSLHHLKKHPECFYSKMHHYLNQRAVDPDFEWSNTEIFGSPFSDEAVRIRKWTFGDHWPYDHLNDSYPTSQKMVDSGFCYYPQEKDDDLAICIYCGVSLEGWEPEDDPLHEHMKRAVDRECFFLKCLESHHAVLLKRSSTSPVSGDAKVSSDTKASNKIDNSQTDDSEKLIGNPRKIRRAVKKVTRSDYIEYSDDDSSVNDKSFNLTANASELESAEEYFESSQKKSASTVPKSNSPSKITLSPKKSKILDSSFNDDDGLFSEKNLNSFSFGKSTKPETQKTRASILKAVRPNKNTSLQDITNVSTNGFPKNSTVSFSQAEIEDGSQIENSDVKTTIKNGQTSVHEATSASALENTSADLNGGGGDDDKEDDDDDDDSIILISNSKDSSIEAFVSNEDRTAQSNLSDSPLKNKISASGMLNKDTSVISTLEKNDTKVTHPLNSKSRSDSENTLRGKASNEDESQTGSKSKGSRSVLSHSRFVESPIRQRSWSPFLDDDYVGTDQIQKAPLIEPDDIPLEESTDHNIQIPGENILKKSEKTITDSESSSASGRSYHSIQDLDDVTFSKRLGEATSWIPSDTNKLFLPLEELEMAKKYLSELRELPYELHNDIDGRVSYFINEMPDNELEMTIHEWIAHTSKQGRIHLEKICDEMIRQFDDECNRAIQKLQSL